MTQPVSGSQGQRCKHGIGVYHCVACDLPVRHQRQTAPAASHGGSQGVAIPDDLHATPEQFDHEASMLLDDIRHEDEGAPERYFVRQALANIYNRAIARSERALRDAETRQAYAELEAQRVGFEQGWEGCKQAAIRIVCDLGNSTAVSEVVRVGQMIVDRMATLARPSQSPEEGQ